jgi:hypothetical protein
VLCFSDCKGKKRRKVSLSLNGVVPSLVSLLGFLVLEPNLPLFRQWGERRDSQATRSLHFDLNTSREVVSCLSFCASQQQGKRRVNPTGFHRQSIEVRSITTNPTVLSSWFAITHSLTIGPQDIGFRLDNLIPPPWLVAVIFSTRPMQTNRRARWISTFRRN